MTFYVYPMRTARRAANQAETREYREEYQPEVRIPVNVRADGDDFIISALVPGVKAEDLSIQVLNDTLTIHGEIADGASEGDRFLLRERPAGKFTRTLRLPDRLSSDRTEAELVDGVLTVKVSKAEEARPRTIKVTTSSN